MMYIILAYDVGTKRVSKVMKVVKKYLLPVQKSVYEGFITESKLKSLKKELTDKIEPEKDGILIYKFSGYGLPDKDILGKNKGEDRFIL